LPVCAYAQSSDADGTKAALCAMSIIDYLARSVDRQAKGLIIKDIAQLSARRRTTFSVLSVGQA